MTFNLFTTRFAIFSTMLTISLMGESLPAEKVRTLISFSRMHSLIMSVASCTGMISLQVFVYSSYFSMLAFTMSGMYVRGFAESAESLVSLKRLTVS